MRAHRRLTIAIVMVAAAVAAPLRAQEEPLLLLACAPGYPGETRQAQPTMDRFAELVARAAGLDSRALVGEYQRDEGAGVDRIRAGADIVVVPLPFFLAHEQELDLRPLVQTVQLSGRELESWSLVARRGRIGQPADLAGWTLAGTPAYAPDFVRGPILAAWGRLPDSVALEFTRNVLGAIRRAVADENVAVLLDGEQSAALPSLPMADELEIVTTSPAWIPALVATVGDAVDSGLADRLRDGLLRVHEADDFTELLTTLRLQRFAPLDGASLERARDRYRDAE